jgi:hypothetical protein
MKMPSSKKIQKYFLKNNNNNNNNKKNKRGVVVKPYIPTTPEISGSGPTTTLKYQVVVWSTPSVEFALFYFLNFEDI